MLELFDNDEKILVIKADIVDQRNKIKKNVFCKGKFHTEKASANIPYSVDFSSNDENSQWVLLNGNQKNGFVVGGDTKSLYITSEPQKGVDAEYGYDSKTESATYAYRLLNLEKGQYTISYDWKSEGSKLDYGRVFLVPTSYTIEDGKRIGSVNVTTYEATLVLTSLTECSAAVLLIARLYCFPASRESENQHYCCRYANAERR